MSKLLFEPTEKQQVFIEKVFDPDYTFISYGGSAGGGKTVVSIASIILLCRLYKKSRWCVIRKSLTEIKLNTLPSFWKICPTNFVKSYNKSEFLVNFKNDSQIIFKGENIHDDPELQWMDGLEVNGFLLEQIEEINRKTYDKCKLRAGRWILDPMPPIKILSTLNPSQNWVKNEIHEPYVQGKLAAPYIYIPAKISDNPYLPEQYKDNLKYLDSLTYARYVDGDWSAFAVDRPFAYAFSEEKHVKECEFDPGHELHLSFDFNVDPITALASQYIDGQIRIIKEFRLQNSNIYELCDRIKAAFPFAVLFVTGDATGQSRSALTVGNINYYTVIMQKLGILPTQVKTPTINPAISDSQVLVNSIFQNFDIIISPECKYLIEDLKYVEVNEYGDIDKTKDKHRSHLLDCHRYTLSTFHSNLLKLAYEIAD